MFEITKITAFGVDVSLVDGNVAVVVTVHEAIRDCLSADFDLYAETYLGAVLVRIDQRGDGPWLRDVKNARSYMAHFGDKLYAVRRSA